MAAVISTTSLEVEKIKSQIVQSTEEEESEEKNEEEEEWLEDGVEVEDAIEEFFRRSSFLREEETSKTDIELLKEKPLGSPSTSLMMKARPSLGCFHDLYSPGFELQLHAQQINYVSVFESIALSTILEELYLQLEILGHSFPGKPVEPEESDFLTYDERFATEVSERDLEYRPTLKNFKNPFIIDESEIGSHQERVSHKIQKDRGFLQEIIRRSQLELEKDRSFQMLKVNVAREDARRHEEVTLMEREQKARKNVEDMRQRIAEFRDQMFRDEHNRKEMINHLKDQLFQEKQKGRQDARYTRSWFEARNDFNFSELQYKTDLAKLKIKHLEIQMTRDRLVHKNIVAWSKLRFEEIQQFIEDWKFKTEIDTEIMEKKIKEKQNILRAQLSMIESLQATIDNRAAELAPWDAEKDQERTERSEAMRLYYSARKIQRWWREYMVKYNLYTKKPKKPKGKGKGKGKKKKGKR